MLVWSYVQTQFVVKTPTKQNINIVELLLIFISILFNHK